MIKADKSFALRDSKLKCSRFNVGKIKEYWTKLRQKNIFYKIMDTFKAKNRQMFHFISFRLKRVAERSHSPQTVIMEYIFFRYFVIYYYVWQMNVW